MSKLKPMFITGANAKIQITDPQGNAITLAYALDVNYIINVGHIAVETMGRYEVISNEPIAYSVAGSLSVVRYTKMAWQFAQGAGKLHGQYQEGNRSELWTPGHFNPGVLLGSRTFDLTIFQKYTEDEVTGLTSQVATKTEKVIKIEDCRFTSRNAGLSKRNLLTEMFNFVGILANDEGQLVSYSGDNDIVA